MGNSFSMKKINYEDMQTVVKNPEIYMLINTLPVDSQDCLISTTVNIDKEEAIINKYLKENREIRIIVYGKHCNDELVDKKYQQLLTLGFNNVYAYMGGLFEWLLLNDIYGKDLFPVNNMNTNKKSIDILRFKPHPILNISLIEY
jgi:hypothetical protein